MSGLHPQQKSLSRLPSIPEFPGLLVRLVHQKREYLDPVSVSPKTSIIQRALIRSALIVISNDGNNMELCVCHSHPSPAVLLPLVRCVQFCLAPVSGAGESVGVVKLMKG